MIIIPLYIVTYDHKTNEESEYHELIDKMENLGILKQYQFSVWTIETHLRLTQLFELLARETRINKTKLFVGTLISPPVSINTLYWMTEKVIVAPKYPIDINYIGDPNA